MALALKVQTNRSADAVKAFPASTTGADLTAQSGCPAHAAQMVVLYNQTAASITAGLTLVPEDPTSPSLSLSIPANAVMPMYASIKTLTTPTGVTAVAYWWNTGTVVVNQHTVSRNA